MIHTLITHVRYTVLKTEGFTSVIPVCSSTELLAQGKYFLSYEGSHQFRQHNLVNDEFCKFYEFPKPIPVVVEHTVWINRLGEIFYGHANRQDQWQKIGNLP